MLARSQAWRCRLPAQLRAVLPSISHRGCIQTPLRLPASLTCVASRPYTLPPFYDERPFRSVLHDKSSTHWSPAPSKKRSQSPRTPGIAQPAPALAANDGGSSMGGEGGGGMETGRGGGGGTNSFGSMGGDGDGPGRRLSSRPSPPPPFTNIPPSPPAIEETPLMIPRRLVSHLDAHVVGQSKAKRVLAVAVFNHYLRVRANRAITGADSVKNSAEEEDVQTLSSTTYIPNTSIRGFSFTRTQHGEPIDPPLPESPHSWSPSSSVISSTTSSTPPGEIDVPTEKVKKPSKARAPKDVSAPPTALKQKKTHPPPSPPTEHTVIYDKSNVLLIGPTGSGKTLLASTLAKILQVPFSMNDATPFTQAGYVGDDVELVIQRLLQNCDWDVSKAEQGIVFIDEIDKLARRPDGVQLAKDVSGEGVQQALLRMLEGTIIHVQDKGRKGAKGETYAVDTSNILFICSGAFGGLDQLIQDRLAKGSIGFGATLKTPSAAAGVDTGVLSINSEEEATPILDRVEPADLIKYGLIPEFIGRLPVLTNVWPLDEDMLVRVLTEPKNALVKQYKNLYILNDITLHVSDAALQAIARRAIKKQTGARGLRRIMEEILLDSMYDGPGSSIRHVVVDRSAAEDTAPARYFSRGQAHEALAIVDAEVVPTLGVISSSAKDDKSEWDAQALPEGKQVKAES